MNAGIQDAVNLGWTLAYPLDGNVARLSTLIPNGWFAAVIAEGSVA